jgi:GGDEF domain-containing protein
MKPVAPEGSSAIRRHAGFLQIGATGFEPATLGPQPSALPTLSVGVVTFGHGDTPSLDQLLHNADAAMYEAKRAGGNQVAIAA